MNIIYKIINKIKAIEKKCGILFTSKYFGLIAGYTNSSGTYTYQVYDPQHNGINGKCTMSSSTRKFTNSDGSQFSWDAGYLTNFQK